MENATHSRIRRLLPVLILVGLASPASTVSAGVGVWTSGGPYGGGINTLAIDPANPATLYAGANSGVFKSTDSGGNWTAINTGMTSGVGALVIDPANPATIYAAGEGVLKSTDGGSRPPASAAADAQPKEVPDAPRGRERKQAGKEHLFFLYSAAHSQPMLRRHPRE